MKQAALLAAAWCAAFAGFAALALAMDRHFEDSFGRGRRPGAARAWLRAGGGVALSASLIACLALQQSQGWVLWFGVMTAAALAVILLLSYPLRRK
jgi:hypothetical protein